MFTRAISLFVSVACVVCGAWDITARAQTNPTQNMSQTEEFRRQAPSPLAPRPLNIPKPYETTLPNGLEIVVVEEPRLPLVSYRLALRTGNALDPKELPGLTSMMTNMLNEGTQTRQSKQIADEVARMGATLSAGTNADYMAVAASALSTFSDQILELLADISLRPTFPEKELELIKQNTLQGLIAQRAQPSFLSDERLSQILFGTHPYSVVAPTPESVQAMTRERLMSFHRAMFVPNNAVLVVVGNVKRDQVVKRATELFGKWEKGTAAQTNFPAPPTRSARTTYVVDRPGSAQSNIVIANLGITRTSPDYFPMLLMHQVLGAGASSRLFMNLREAKGYTYGAYSELDTRRFAGTFRTSAEVRSEVTGDSLKEFFLELERIRNEAVPDKEMKDAKSYLTGVFPIRLETQEGLTNQLVQMKMLGLPADFLHTYRERVNAVTAADIQRVARQYVTPDRVAIVIVGDARAIMNQIKPYAEKIELFDTAGKPKTLDPSTATTTTTKNGGNSVATGPAANVAGIWNLTITGPGGQIIPAMLTIRQEGGQITGSVQTQQLGEAPLKNATLNGNNFDADLSFNMQGQAINAKVTGNVDREDMKGTINVDIPNFPPLPFTGSRTKP
jgi:zinc protease